MKDCPQCGAMVDGLECGRCGFRDAGAAKEAARQRALNEIRSFSSMTPEERDRMAAACAPHIARCKAILAAAQKKWPKGHILNPESPRSTDGIAFDPEAIAERQALIDEAKLVPGKGGF